MSQGLGGVEAEVSPVSSTSLPRRCVCSKQRQRADRKSMLNEMRPKEFDTTFSILGPLNTLVRKSLHVSFMSRVGQNRIYTPYMAVFLVISLPKIPIINGIP